jgi:imidazolonepropionase
MPLLLTNIGLLAGIHAPQKPLRGEELGHVPMLHDAWLLSTEGIIHSYGSVHDGSMPLRNEGWEVLDCEGGIVHASWVDSHTHAVFAGSREAEFVMKIKGATYAEIAAGGGGILHTARAVNGVSEEELFAESLERIQERMAEGTGAIEIKSGYGLSVDGELKMLRVIKRLKMACPIPIKASFLGAHALPPAFTSNRDGFINSILYDMLPRIAEERLADFMDVFCEGGFFTPKETIKLLEAGKQYGLKPKIHANQLTLSGGVQVGVSMGALSVDHLEQMDEAAIDALATQNTIGTLLPASAFFLRLNYPAARQLINRNCAIALASDFNPGSCPSGDMHFVASLACIQMRMTPEEAFNAATINGAFAMDLQQEAGSIATGKRANLIITKRVPSFAYLFYAFGSNHIRHVCINGALL